MADVNGHVKTVIEVLHDGYQGFNALDEHLGDPAAKQFSYPRLRHDTSLSMN
jgi:hypothetical protein